MLPPSAIRVTKFAIAAHEVPLGTGGRPDWQAGGRTGRPAVKSFLKEMVEEEIIRERMKEKEMKQKEKEMKQKMKEKKKLENGASSKQVEF